MPDITYSEDRVLPLEPLQALYSANGWSAADHPEILQQALVNSHSLVTAWEGSVLVGLGNAISDGHLVVYYPHLLVLPDHQGKGIGSEIVRRLKLNYQGFHQQVIVADRNAAEFYRKRGFSRAGETEPMWIYAGKDH